MEIVNNFQPRHSCTRNSKNGKVRGSFNNAIQAGSLSAYTKRTENATSTSHATNVNQKDSLYMPNSRYGSFLL